MCQVSVSPILRGGRRYATYSSGWSLNRCVFSLDLKVACDGQDCTSFGREFHTVGETKQKDRLAKSDATWGTVSRRTASCSGRDVRNNMMMIVWRKLSSRLTCHTRDAIKPLSKQSVPDCRVFIYISVSNGTYFVKNNNYTKTCENYSAE